mgnify:CR=1 FL=1
MTNLVIVGGSVYPELQQLILSLNEAGQNFKVIGYLDDTISNEDEVGLRYLGRLEDAGTLPDCKFVFAIGSERTRLKRLEILASLNVSDDRFETLIHPSAVIYPTSKIGRGTIIHAGVVIGNDTRIGSFCIILWNSVIGARNDLGEAVMVASQVATNADVSIGTSAYLGAACAVADGLGIGKGAMVCMGSIVLSSVRDGEKVFGNPARVIDRI